ncbi:MAG: DUF2071 domain-containing protein [Blastocatellia bacterium]
MTTDKLMQMVMRDMLFITWTVEPERLRKLVNARLELDTRTDSTGRVVAFVSAVCFRVTEMRSSTLPLPDLSFEQVNYRAYVRSGETPASSFLDMKVNSRTITALTSFLNIPVHYEDIDIATRSDGAGLLHYSFRSAGLKAEAVIGEQSRNERANGEVEPDFLTRRFVGYAGLGESLFKLVVDQPGLDTRPARIERVEAPRLVELGVLGPDQSEHPAALYVRDALFGTNAPIREK